MKRRDLLGKACGLGMCGCLTSVACGEESTPQAELKAKNKELNRVTWWLKHGKKQWAKLWETLPTCLDQNTCEKVIEELGRNCFKNIPWLQKYQGDPEGFFAKMNQKHGETFTYDKEQGRILVVTRERDCDCQFIDSKKTPPIACHCSVGWQKQAYETILGKKVDVTVKESVLRGSKRCVFEIQVKQEA